MRNPPTAVQNFYSLSYCWGTIKLSHEICHKYQTLWCQLKDGISVHYHGHREAPIMWFRLCTYSSLFFSRDVGKPFQGISPRNKEILQRLLNLSLTLNLAAEQLLPFTFLFSWKQNNISIPHNVMDHSHPSGWRNAISIRILQRTKYILQSWVFVCFFLWKDKKKKRALGGEKGSP